MSTENPRLSFEVFEAPGSAAARIIYWGVICRTCNELVPFDVCPYLSFGAEAASMRPGAIRCIDGHNHIYFPRDFAFTPSAITIPEEVMRVNRVAYQAINPSIPSAFGKPALMEAGVENEPQPTYDIPRKGVQLVEKDCWTYGMKKMAV